MTLDVAKLAKQAGIDAYPDHLISYESESVKLSVLERFASLVLEEAAKVCDDLDAMSRDPMVARGSADECAEAIRELSKRSS